MKPAYVILGCVVCSAASGVNVATAKAQEKQKWLGWVMTAVMLLACACIVLGLVASSRGPSP